MFSPPHTLKEGPIYLLGTDPTVSAMTIDQHLEYWLENMNRHVYIDGNQGRLQRQLQALFDHLDVGLRGTCTTTVFVSTRTAAECTSTQAACWRVHQTLIRVIQPQVLLVFGNSRDSPYEFIKWECLSPAGRRLRTDDEFPTDHGNVCLKSMTARIEGRPRLHALAVLLFEILMIAHPLKGRKEFSLPAVSWDPDNTKRLYGTEPLFIFDSLDRSNEPVPGHHDAALNFWPVYPRFLQEMFTRAFTAGLRDPDKRPTENEWRRTMCRLRDAIFNCHQCGAENFYDVQHLRESGGTPRPRWCCRAPVQLPARMRLGNEVIVLTPGTQLFPHHIEERLYQFTPPMADVVANPLGLRNRSGRPWTMASGDSVQKVPAGEVVPLMPGMTIDFGTQQGQIRL